MLDALKRRKTVLAAIGALAIGLTWFSSSIEGKSDLDPFDRAVLWITHPLLEGLHWVSGSVRTAWGRYVYLVGVEEENRVLREVVEKLESQNSRLVEETQENRRLRALLGFRERAPSLRTVAAEVIGVDVGPENRMLIIDKGTADGVHKDAAVVTDAGVVGKVVSVERSVSTVLELLDHRSRVDVLIQRSRAKALVQGRGAGTCRLAYLERREDVRVGDLVVTSGMGKIFPKGLRVGTVSSVVPASTGLFQQAELEPAVEFARIEEVLVLPLGTAGPSEEED